jgi:hypothetical protein
VASLALALDGTWVLHAASVLLPDLPGGPLAVLVGPSGIGKSTLARFLAGESRTGGRPRATRLSDDLLPIEGSGGELTALPAFPQPRWPADRQPGPKQAERIPIRALFVPSRPEGTGPEEDGPAPRCERLAARDAAVALIHQTVGGALFDDALLARHLAFAGAAAAAVPVHRLAYPLRMDVLPAVESRIFETLDALVRSPERSR